MLCWEYWYRFFSSRVNYLFSKQLNQTIVNTPVLNFDSETAAMENTNDPWSKTIITSKSGRTPLSEIHNQRSFNKVVETSIKFTPIKTIDHTDEVEMNAESFFDENEDTVIASVNILESTIVIKPSKSELKNDKLDGQGLESSTSTKVESIIETPQSEELRNASDKLIQTINSQDITSTEANSLNNFDHMNLALNHKFCSEKNSELTTKIIDKDSEFDAKWNEIEEILAKIESEFQNYVTQTSAHKSELLDLKRKENDLRILVEKYKAKGSITFDSDSLLKDKEIETLKTTEISLNNEITEMKSVVENHKVELKQLQQKEDQLVDFLTSKTHSEFKQIVKGYEEMISSLMIKNDILKKDKETAEKHLSNIEIAFTDVHQKYERCKEIIKCYKQQEESFKTDIGINQETIATQEMKYNVLKTHCMEQLEKSNIEFHTIKQQHEKDMKRTKVLLKQYEIKNEALLNAVKQKTMECYKLSAICDEYIGKI